MLVDGELGHCHFFRFAASDFVARADRFEVRIGPNLFTASMLQLSLDHETSLLGTESIRVQVQARISVTDSTPWPVTLLSPGVMGWFAYMPWMECYHGILSMHSRLNGTVTRVIGNRTAQFDLTDGVGYVEKDWGITFPNPYVWLACNHFFEPSAQRYGTEVTSLFLSVARIPGPMDMPFAFTGFIAGLQHEGRLYSFATYTGAWMGNVALNDTALSVTLKDMFYTLSVVAERQPTVLLYGPRNGRMEPVIPEGLGHGRVWCRLSKTWTGETVFQGTGRNTGIELVGDISANTPQPSA